MLFMIPCSLGEKISSHTLDDLSFQMEPPRAEGVQEAVFAVTHI